MRTRTALALASLLTLGAGLARGQESPAPLKPGEVELLELQQDVDRTLLREAMTRLGGLALRPAAEQPVSDEAHKQQAEHEARLRDFIEMKRHAYLERAAEIQRRKAAPARPAAQAARRPDAPKDDRERHDLMGELEESQIEVQLLQTEMNLYQQPLTQAVQNLAAAEFAAGDDESGKAKVDAARKAYEKAKERYVGLSKRFALGQQKVEGLQMRLNVGGMGGGFR